MSLRMDAADETPTNSREACYQVLVGGDGAVRRLSPKRDQPETTAPPAELIQAVLISIARLIQAHPEIEDVACCPA